MKMKNVLIACSLIFAIYACNESSTSAKPEAKTEEKTEAKVEETDNTDSPEFQKGLALVRGSDCVTCHKVDEKTTGPAFREIANKYPKDDATITTLAQKIIAGGQGNWGTIPMAAHPTISLEDAKAMATYVLLLKNN